MGLGARRDRRLRVRWFLDRRFLDARAGLEFPELFPRASGAATSLVVGLELPTPAKNSAHRATATSDQPETRTAVARFFNVASGRRPLRCPNSFQLLADTPRATGTVQATYRLARRPNVPREPRERKLRSQRRVRRARIPRRRAPEKPSRFPTLPARPSRGDSPGVLSSPRRFLHVRRPGHR